MILGGEIKIGGSGMLKITSEMFRKGGIPQERLEEMQYTGIHQYWYLETDEYIDSVYAYVSDIVERLGEDFSVIEMGSNLGLILKVLGNTHPYIGLDGSVVATARARTLWANRLNAAFIQCRFEALETVSDATLKVDVVFFAACLLYFLPEYIGPFIEEVLRKTQAKYFIVSSPRLKIADMPLCKCLEFKVHTLQAPGIPEKARIRYTYLYEVKRGGDGS